MALEARAARAHRVFEPAGAPVLFGKRAERDGGRVLSDPALEFLDARKQTGLPGVRRPYFASTVIALVSEELLPWLSVTVSVTRYVPAAV